MDRWSSRRGKRQRRERKKKEDQRRESVRRKKMQVREKAEKSRNTVFFQCVVTPENAKNTAFSEHFWKSRRWTSAQGCGETRISRPKWSKHPIVGALLEVKMFKKCTLLWRKAHFQAKMVKTPVLEVQCLKKCTPLWREVSMFKTHHVRTTFGRWDVQKVHGVVSPTFGRPIVVLCGRRNGCCIWLKVSQTCGFAAFSKTIAGVRQETC